MNKVCPQIDYKLLYCLQREKKKLINVSSTEAMADLNIKIAKRWNFRMLHGAKNSWLTCYISEDFSLKPIAGVRHKCIEFFTFWEWYILGGIYNISNK